MPWLSSYPPEGLFLYAARRDGLLAVTVVRPGRTAVRAFWDAAAGRVLEPGPLGVRTPSFSGLLAPGQVSPGAAAWLDGALSDPSGLDALLEVMQS